MIPGIASAIIPKGFSLALDAMVVCAVTARPACCAYELINIPSRVTVKIWG